MSKIIPLSFSAWKDAECPFRFRVLRIDRSYKEPETEALQVGSEVARLLQDYRNTCIIRGLRNDASFFDANKELIPEPLRERVWKLIKAFIASEFVNVPIGPKWMHVEGKFAFDSDLKFLGTTKDAWLSPRVAFRSVADFCYYDPAAGELVIIDDKTGFGEPDELQLRLYAHLIRIAWMHYHNSIAQGMQLQKVRCVFNNLATQSKQELEFEPGETNGMREIILERIREVNAMTEWPARVCSMCKWCSVPGCENRESARQALVTAEASPVISIPEKIELPADAEKALLFVSFAEDVVARVKDLLKVWVEEHGPVSHGGKIAQFSDRESWKPVDLARLCKALIAYGATPELVWNNLSLTKSALETVVKKAKLEPKLPFIEAMVEKKSSKTFTIGNDRIK